MSLPVFKLLRPRNILEAVGYLARHGGDVQILAGGTDLLPSMTSFWVPGRRVASSLSFLLLSTGIKVKGRQRFSAQFLTR